MSRPSRSNDHAWYGHLKALLTCPQQLAGLVEQLRPPVGADVVEGARLAGRVAGHDHRLAGDVADEEVAGGRELLVAADADPAAEPDALALVGVDGLARVVGAGERRARRPVAAAQVLPALVAAGSGGGRVVELGHRAIRRRSS